MKVHDFGDLPEGHFVVEIHRQHRLFDLGHFLYGSRYGGPYLGALGEAAGPGRLAISNHVQLVPAVLSQGDLDLS